MISVVATAFQYKEFTAVQQRAVEAPKEVVGNGIPGRRANPICVRQEES
jgi:hypothetical protein